MTIIYQYKVANTTLGGFLKLLTLWKGSVYKLVFKEVLIFSFLYTGISLIYRLALNAEQRIVFEKIAQHCDKYTSLIPVSFVLGFYVSLVVTRWWQQYRNVPWPDRTCFLLSCYLHGDDDRGRILRRTVARYLLFGLILILRSISVAVMKRFPTLDHIAEAGFITHEEAILYEAVQCKYNKFWVPLMWANGVLVQARRENRIESEWGLRMVIEPLADFRDRCSLCFQYDWITIPLVYTQVVTLAVHMFFAACLIGRQFLDPGKGYPGYEYDLYVPVFTLLQFFFYMGWLKVAEQLINPFGEDDDDIDTNWLIDRHTAVAMHLVDQCYGSFPPLVKDLHYNEVTSELPYTKASMASRKPVFLGSTYNLERPTAHDQKVIPPEAFPELQPRHRKLFSVVSHGGGGGSLWSLFGWKPNLRKGHHTDSIGTENSSLANGYLQIPHSYSTTTQDNYYPGDTDSQDFLPPEYVPLRRARAQTDVDQRPLKRVQDSDSERKWSFPLSLLKRRNAVPENVLSEQPSGSDPTLPNSNSNSSLNRQQPRPRFVVETVTDENEIDPSKHARNAQIIDKLITGKAVSRAPLLSAIEEGNTITSLKQLVSSDESETEKEEDIETIPEEAEPEHSRENVDSNNSCFAPYRPIPRITIDMVE